MTNDKNLKAIERDKWMGSADGRRCTSGTTEGQILRKPTRYGWRQEA